MFEARWIRLPELYDWLLPSLELTFSVNNQKRDYAETAIEKNPNKQKYSIHRLKQLILDVISLHLRKDVGNRKQNNFFNLSFSNSLFENSNDSNSCNVNSYHVDRLYHTLPVSPCLRRNIKLLSLRNEH